MRLFTGQRNLVTIVMFVTTLAACQPNAITVRTFPPELHGAVRWSLDSWHTAATVGDIQANGTVALVDPTTRTTLYATQASGATGTFTFPFTAQGFTVAPGFYWLEAVRFLSGERNAGVTLRTILRYTGTAWDSISGADIQVSPLTTAIARVRALDPTVTDAATMHTVDATHHLLAPVGGHPIAELQQLAVEVEATVTAGGDGAGDLPLAASVLPVRGTPGITLLHWSGMPAQVDFVRQLATGVDATGAVHTDNAGAGQTTADWVAVAPAGMIGPVQLRLQKGTARTAPVTWTPVGTLALGQADSLSVATGGGPAGPMALWSAAVDNKLRWAPLLAEATGPVTVLGAAGSEFAITSSAESTRHILNVVAGVPYHQYTEGPDWTNPVAVPVADAGVTAPQLAPDGQGGVWGAWIADSASTRRLQVARFTGGAWQPAQTIATTGTVDGFSLAGGFDPQLAWCEHPGAVGQVRYSKRVSGVWQAPTTLSAAGQNTVGNLALALDSLGQPHVLWIDQATVGVGRIAQNLGYRVQAAGVWQPQERVMTTVTPTLSQPCLAIDPFGVPLALWQAGGTAPLVQTARRSSRADATGTWSRTMILDRAGATGLVGVAGADRFWALWRQGTALQGSPVVW